MCFDPVSMTAATIAMGIGTAVSAAGSIMEGDAARAAGDLQEQAYKQQAQADKQAAAFEMQRERYQQDLAAGRARAQVGASGVAFQGSPTGVLTAQAREGQLDLEAIRYGSRLRQNQLRTQGQIAAFGGQQAQTAGYISAGTKAVRFGTSIFANPTSPFSTSPSQ